LLAHVLDELAWGFGFRVSGFGFRISVWGSGLRVQGVPRLWRFVAYGIFGFQGSG